MDSYKSLSDKELVALAIKQAEGPDRLAKLIGGYEGQTVNGWRFKTLPKGMRNHIEMLLEHVLRLKDAEGRKDQRTSRAG